MWCEHPKDALPHRQSAWGLQVVGPAKELCRSCPGTQVLLQPATGDAQHLPVHPQPAFVGALLAPAESLPAPAHVRCGASLISVTSAAVFADLGSSECGKQVPPCFTTTGVSSGGLRGCVHVVLY